MRFIWKGWPEPVKAGPSAPRVRDVILPGEGWKLVAEGFKSARPGVQRQGRGVLRRPVANKIYRIGLDGKVSVFLADTGQANAVSVGPKGELYTVSEKTGKLMCYDAAGKGRVDAEGHPGHYVLARPDGSLYVTSPGTKPDAGSRIWLVKDGRRTVSIQG